MTGARVPLVDFDFTFAGASYSEAQDLQAAAWFDSGVLLGISYLAGVAGVNQLSFSPGFFDTTDASFAYNIASGVGDNGLSGILFTEASQTPEPPTWAMLMLAGALGAIVRRGRRRA